MPGCLFSRRGAKPENDGIDTETFRAEILDVNLRRISRLALVLVPVHLAHVVLFWFHTPAAGPVAESWRRGILSAHALMLPVAVGLASLGHARVRQRLGLRSRAVIPGASALLYVLFGAALAVIDQLVTSNITPFLLVSIGIAAAVIMRPLTATTIFAVLLLSFWFMIGWTQHDPEILLSLRVNSISTVGAGFGIAYLLWHNQVLMFRQRQEIMAQKISLEEKNAKLARLANRDPLTGLANRSQLVASAATEVARMRRRGSTASLILIDLDHFKVINDSYGHPVGDAILRQVAQELSAVVRHADTLARLGGDEFVVLLPDTPLAAAADLAERLRAAVEIHNFHAGEVPVRLTASFGVAPLSPTESDPLNVAYRIADQMLYRAKASGRNQASVADDHVELEVEAMAT